MQPRTQIHRKLVGIHNDNFTVIKIRGVGPLESLNIALCLPAMTIIARQLGLRMNRNDNMVIIQKVLERMVDEN